MSLATHAITKNAPAEAPPPLMNRNACMNDFTLNNMFKPSAFAQPETLFQTHAPFAHGQAWGQPWMPYSTAAMPSVDVLVLPKQQQAAQTKEQTQASADCDVKVSYTSAEDLANVLFPTHGAADSQVRLQQLHSDVNDLSEHRELVHDALEDHKRHLENLKQRHDDFESDILEIDDNLEDHKRHIGELNKMHANLQSEFQEMDHGLKDHQSHIRDIQENTAKALKQLKAHEKHIGELSRSVQCLHSSAGSSDMTKQVSTLEANTRKLESQFTAHASSVAEKVDSVHRQVDRLSRSQADMHLGLQTHTKYLDKHALELNALDDRLASAVKDTSSRSSAAQVDFTVLAPCRR